MPLCPSHDRQDVFQGGVQAERGCRRDAQHEPQAVGGEKANAVNLIGQPIRVLTDQPDRIVAIRLAHPPRISFAQADVAQPRVDIGDGGDLRERLVDRMCTTQSDALDRTQVLWAVAYDLDTRPTKRSTASAARTCPRWVV